MDTSLTILELTAQELACLPLGFHVIYCKPTLGASENQATRLYSRRYDSVTQEIAQLHKPISRVLDR